MTHQHLTLCFGPSGFVAYPDADNREQLASNLARLIQVLQDDPAAIRCLAGACDGTCGHSTSWAKA